MVDHITLVIAVYNGMPVTKNTLAYANVKGVEYIVIAEASVAVY